MDKIQTSIEAVSSLNARMTQTQDECTYLVVLGDLVENFVNKEIYEKVKARAPTLCATKTAFLDFLKLKRPDAVNELLAELARLSMDIRDYNALVSVKNTRNKTFHASLTAMQRVDYIENHNVGKYSAQRALVIKYKSIFA